MATNIIPDYPVIITGEQILDWHGSDHSIEELAQILADVLNWDYSISTARKDIIEYE